MILSDNRTDHTLDLKLLEQITDNFTSRDIELILCDDTAITAINQEFRDKNRPTDVLSFPCEGEFEHLPLGSIIISLDHAQAAATELGHALDDELALLFVHGLLHLLGFDHETDEGQMREREQEILVQLGLPKSLTIRTEES